MITSNKPNPRQIDFISDAERKTGRSRQTLRRWWESENFPKPKLLNNRLAWRSEVIDKWINQNI